MSALAPSMFTPEAKAMAAKLGLAQGRANLDEFADVLLGLAKADRNVLAVTSDSRGSGKLTSFGNALPRQIVEVGIAEQNLVGVAAGLASTGKKVFAVSPASFVSARSLEQIKNDVCYSDRPVKIVGISAGVSYGALGTTHHSLHDLAALRAINNIDIVVPADNHETQEAVHAAVQHERPLYLRFGKAPMHRLHPAGSPFRVGQAITLKDGDAAALIGTGETVVHCLLAAAWLQERHQLKCRVISMHTVKPLDVDCVLAAGRQCGAVVTAEEHMIYGGLGEACAATLMQEGVTVPFRIVGIPDEYTVTGAQVDIFRHYGITMEGLAQSVLQLLRRS